MTKIIILQGDSLESYYEQTLEYLHTKYHSSPSIILESPSYRVVGSHEDPPNSVGYYENLARNIAERADSDKPASLGKLVI